MHNQVMYTSSGGETKSLSDWQNECAKFYNTISKECIIDKQWERYKRVLGLRPEQGLSQANRPKPVGWGRISTAKQQGVLYHDD